MSIFRRKNRPHQPSRQKLDAAISNILDQAINVDSDKAPEHLRIVLMKENPLWKLTERRVARYLKRHLKARQNPIAERIDADMDEQTVYTTISTNTTNTKEVAVAPPIVNNKSIPEDGTPEADTPATTPTAAGMSGGDEGTATDSNTDTDVTKDTTDENVESSEKTTDEVVETATDAAAEEEGGEVKATKADDAADADVAVKSGDDTEAANAETETKDDSVPTEVVNVAGQRDVTEDYSDDNDGEAEGMVCFGTSCVIS